MADSKSEKVRLKDFPANFWILIFFEFIERGAYYGVFSVLAVYWTDYLDFSYSSFGTFKSTLIPIFIYGFPLVTGAIADRMGFRKTLMVAFSLMGTGYLLASQAHAHAALFISLVIMGIGAGTFKPIISGSIAKLTNEKNSTVGFAVFYWSINLGAFLVPLILVPALKVWDETLKAYDYSNVLLYAGIATMSMLIPAFFIYKEPAGETIKKSPLGITLKDIFSKVWMVILDWKFILFLFIYALFWILYFQMYGSVLWFIEDMIDPTALNNFVNNMFGENWVRSIFGSEWQFDVEHVTVINAGTIILLQILVSSVVKNTKTIPTLITGIFLGTAGMAILAFSSNIWIVMAGIMIFTLGEMTAHPKYIAYLGTIAPPDKKATYMGFSFIYGFFGALFAGILEGQLYPRLVLHPMIDKVNSSLTTGFLDYSVKAKEIFAKADQAMIPKQEVINSSHSSELWLLFSLIGIASIIGLLLYRKFIGTRKAGDLG